jgi:hypothetical protein
MKHLSRNIVDGPTQTTQSTKAKTKFDDSFDSSEVTDNTVLCGSESMRQRPTDSPLNGKSSMPEMQELPSSVHNNPYKRQTGLFSLWCGNLCGKS